MKKPLCLAALVLVLAPVLAEARTDGAFASALDAGRRSILASAPMSPGAEEQDLLDALNSRRPEDRVLAFKGLKRFVHLSDRARETTLRHLAYASEDLSVRVEAARALSPAAGDATVREALLKLAKGRGSPTAARAMAYKSLYWQAQYDESVRREVLDAAQRESDAAVRLAAIWALMYAGGDLEVRRALLDMAGKDADASVRREAAKSLYSEMADSDVRRFARDTAQRGSGELRYVGIMMLSTRMFEEDARLLEGIAKNDSDAKARQHAVTALAAPLVDVVYFFHQNHYQWVGRINRLISEAIDRE